jgi:sigma-E factor negative regulatory protein RseA
MERVSAMMDGELDESEVTRTVLSLKERDELREAWDTYHLIGETMRGELSRTGTDIRRTVAARLQSEPTVLAPKSKIPQSARRYLWPSMAAAAAMATVTWMSVRTEPPTLGPTAQTANVPFVLPVSASATGALAELVQPASLSAPPLAIQFPARRIDAYLQAHQEFSPSRTITGLTRSSTPSGIETGR